MGSLSMNSAPITQSIIDSATKSDHEDEIEITDAMLTAGALALLHAHNSPIDDSSISTARLTARTVFEAMWNADEPHIIDDPKVEFDALKFEGPA